MPKFLILWELEPTFTPTDPAERVKLWLTMTEWVKADMAAGVIKDWGGDIGTGGYGISELSETELFSALLKWMPYVKFDVRPMLTVDQTLDAIKKLAQK